MFLFLALAWPVGAIKILFLQDLLSNDVKRGFELSLQTPGVNISEEAFFCECRSPETVTSCIEQARNESVDAMVVGSAWNDEIKRQAEQHQIPNLHCTGGGDPLASAALYAFDLLMPFTSYSLLPIREASRRQLTSAVLIRDDSTLRLGAVAAQEFLRESSIALVGPTERWCSRWQNLTTCSIREGVCRCGAESEFNNLGFRATAPSFYEVSRALVGNALVAFVESIIEDVRSQTDEDPDVVLNFLEDESSGFEAMDKMKLRYKMYYGARIPSDRTAGGSSNTLYNMGGGPWHPGLSFSDPIFGSSTTMVSRFHELHGRVPSSEAVAGAAAGVLLLSAPLAPQAPQARRQALRSFLRRYRGETVLGRMSFDGRQQNSGSAVNWQVFDGETRVVLPYELRQSDMVLPSPDARLGCPPGTLGAGSECRPCQAGSFRSTPSPPLTSTQCERCPAGRGTDKGVTGLVECPLCSAGRFPDASGVCQECPLGRFRSANSTEGCLPCGAGEFANATGLAACMPCPPHSSQPEVGQSNCVCNVGFYKDPIDIAVWGNSLPCLECYEQLPGSTTQYPNARSSNECVCPVGSYWHRLDSESAVAHCKPCGRGLVCTGGRADGVHQAPLQAKGFRAGLPDYEGGQPSYVISCANNLRCPADLPLGACAPNSYGKACERCVSQHYDDNGICRSCTDTPLVVWPMAVLCLCLLFSLGALYLFATRVDRSHRDSLGIVVISAFLAFVFMIEFPMFAKIDVELVEPLRSLRSMSRFLTFDLDVLRLECWMEGHNPLLNYLGAVSAYPCLAVFLFLAFAFGKYVMKRDINCNAIIQAQGVLLLAIYLVLAAISMRPYKCMGNPDGTASVAKHREVLCWTDESHYVMIGMSLISLLSTILSFITFLIQKVWQYPDRLRRSGGAKFAKRWSFIFTHFMPRCYYFSLVVTARNLLLGVIPAMLIARSSLLLIFYTGTITVYCVTQVRLWPWKTLSANVADTGLSCLLILSLVLGIMLLDFDQAQEILLMQILSMIIVVISFLGVLAVIVHGVYRSYKPKRTYGIFLSHHKLGAGMLARWMKMMMADIIKNRIFLDSDDVNKLDQILNVASYDTENVVVLITPETLKRMWCAAEIASAWKASTNIVFVSCDGSTMDEQVISSVPSLWSEEQEATLESAGVTMAEIAEAYEALRDSLCVALDRRGAKEKHHRRATEEILEQCRGLSVRKFSSSSRLTVVGRRASLGTGEILMLGDLRSPEPASCGRVIQTLLRGQLQEDVIFLDPSELTEDLNSAQNQLEGALALLVLLTQGVLKDSAFAGALALCPEQQRNCFVPLRADEQFIYPDASFWESLAAGQLLNTEVLEAMGTDVEEVRSAYAKLFNVLALKFTPHGSEHIQATEILMISGRLRPMLDISGGVSRQDSRSKNSRASSKSSRSSEREAPSWWVQQELNSEGEMVEIVKEVF